MQEWKGRTRGNLLGFSIFIFVLRHIGLGFAYFILLFVAFYFFIFSNKKSIFFYFRQIHSFSVFKSIIHIYLNYYFFGKVLLDKTLILMKSENKFTFNFENEDYIRNMNDGGLLISAHVGSWEIAGQLLNRIETKFNILLIDAEHAKIKQFLDRTYKNKNFNIIIVKDDLSHIFEINRAIKAKELICMHGDRFINPKETIEIDFMGRKALFPKGPFYLASRYNVPVSFVFAMKDSFRHYHFSATAPVIYHNDCNEIRHQVEKAMQDYIYELEKVVKKYPLQWFNYYQFWNQ